MFKIGEFSRLTQVSIRMLRYYDETGLLKPAETDRLTGYRLYSAAQIPALNKIVFLRDLGFNVSDIAQALHEWSDGHIMGLLEAKRPETEGAIKAGQDRLARLALAKRDIEREQIAIHSNVPIKAVPSYQVLSPRRVVPDHFPEGLLWKVLAAFAG